LIASTGAVVSGQPNSTVNGKTAPLNSLASIGIQALDPQNGVDSGYTTPGVTTAGWNTYGLLEINTTQLTAALQADPNAVMNLFTNNPMLAGGSGDASQTGIAIQLYNSLTNSMSNITQEAGMNPMGTTPTDSSGILPASAIDPNGDFKALFGSDASDISNLGSSIQDLDSRATDMQSQLSDMQQRYQTQFSQMEQALSQLNSQSSSLMSMLGQSSSSSGG
jgi:flagellar hook-associated protein 2